MSVETPQALTQQYPLERIYEDQYRYSFTRIENDKDVSFNHFHDLIRWVEDETHLVAPDNFNKVMVMTIRGSEVALAEQHTNRKPPRVFYFKGNQLQYDLIDSQVATVDTYHTIGGNSLLYFGYAIKLGQHHNSDIETFAKHPAYDLYKALTTAREIGQRQQAGGLLARLLHKR